MIPLLDRELYDRFVALQARMPQLGVSNLAHVFVPVGATTKETGPGSLRVLFVGRATRCFGEERLSSFEGALKRATEIVTSDYLPHQGKPKRSDFWRFVRNVLLASLDGLGAPGDARLADHMGWSNLAKIGDKLGNATPLSISIQQELCREALRAEIAVMRPHAVVILTGGYTEKEVVLPVFGEADWRSEVTGRAKWCWKSAEPLCSLIVRTEHPQGKHDMGDAAAAIGARIATAGRQ